MNNHVFIDIFSTGLGRCSQCGQLRKSAVHVIENGPYDDSDPILAALDYLGRDEQATDAQRRIADMAIKEIKFLRCSQRVIETVYVSYSPNHYRCNKCGLQEIFSTPCPLCDGQMMCS